MVKTKKQAIAAVNEIKRKTGWKLSRIADECGVHRATIVRLMSPEANEPNEDTRKAIYLVQLEVRAMP